MLYTNSLPFYIEHSQILESEGSPRTNPPKDTSFGDHKCVCVI
jgi:hypothetical protein